MARSCWENIAFNAPCEAVASWVLCLTFALGGDDWCGCVEVEGRGGRGDFGMGVGDKMDKSRCFYRWLSLRLQGFPVFEGAGFGTYMAIWRFGGQNAGVLSTLAWPWHCNAWAFVKFARTKVGGVLSHFVQMV